MALLDNSGCRISEEPALPLPNCAHCVDSLTPQPPQGREPGRKKRRRAGRVAGWGLFVFLFAFSFNLPAAGSETFKEYELKAAYLYNFTQFVDWPPEAFPAPDTPLVIGVLGADPFGRNLDVLVNNEVVKNRRLVVQRYRRAADIGICHILFISGSETERVEQILAVLKGKPILTVGDSSSFAFRGGIIRLLTDKNKIRLKINMEAAKAANLTISSKLLRAADLVGNDELGRRL